MMDLNEFQKRTEKTAEYPGYGTGSLIAINYCMLGLGEAGEAQGKLKKVWRGDRPLDNAAKHEMMLEVMDAAWYCARVVHELGYTFEDAAEFLFHKLEKRKAEGKIKGDGDNR